MYSMPTSSITYSTIQQHEGCLVEKEDSPHADQSKEVCGRKVHEWRKTSYNDFERDHECGICMEICTKMVLPSCNRAMYINCYRDRNLWSQTPSPVHFAGEALQEFYQETYERHE